MPQKRALIVDDSSTAQYHLKKMLLSYDLDIDSVDSGEAALLYLAKHVPDVVFMDHLMPGMDGFRVLQIIKSHPETAMIPVIMYTSKSGDVYTGQARALGALDVISKDSINAVDLSKVMHSIHIESRVEPAMKHADDTENTQPDVTASNPALNVEHPQDTSSDGAPTDAGRERYIQQIGADNSRRIELRIVQLEHAIDDSRRMIAAQLIREMQKFRHNLKHEFSNIFSRIEKKQEPSTNNSIASTPLPTSRKWSPGVIVLLLLITLFAALLARQNSQLNQLVTQQNARQLQLQAMNNLLSGLKIESVTQQEIPPPSAATLDVSSRAQDDLLQNFVWAFNQSGFLPYSSTFIEPNAIVRINEFINRLDDMDYRGDVEINFSAGDFCVVMDEYGQAQLPNPGTQMADCLLLSELYSLDARFEQVISDLFLTLARTAAVSSGDIRIVIQQLESQSAGYPTRQPELLASDWNGIAHNNNRVDIALGSAEDRN